MATLILSFHSIFQAEAKILDFLNLEIGDKENVKFGSFLFKGLELMCCL